MRIAAWWLAPLGLGVALWTGLREAPPPTVPAHDAVRVATAAVRVPHRLQTNSVTITPSASTIVTGSVSVTVTWCGYPVSPQTQMDINSRVITANGVDVTGDFDLQADPAACGFVGSVADEVLYTSTGDVTVNGSTGPVTVFADVSNALNYHWQDNVTYYPPDARRRVAVVSAMPFVTPLQGARSARFTVTNTGSATDTFALSAPECSGSGMSSCSVAIRR